MILDTLDNWKKHLWPGDRFRAGFEFLQSLSPDVEDGKVELDGKNLFCAIETYETTSVEGHEFESHHDYADIQCLLEGEESILWAPREGLTVTKAYEPDIEFQALTEAPTELVLEPGLFCVLFPQDAHAPCVAHGAPRRVKKAVIKVRLA